MNVLCVTHAPRGSRTGNRVTALRWAAILRSLGHRVRVRTELRAERPDLLVVLHAFRGRESVRACRERLPRVPVVVCLTGTDVYRDLRERDDAADSLRLADRIIGLHPGIAREFDSAQLRDKVRVIVQSARPPRDAPPPRTDAFEVAVVGHLREVKDPFLAAIATRGLPEGSRVRVLHVGRALEPDMEPRARDEERKNPRYRWLGERTRAETLRLIASSRALVLTSRFEGGANVISEAVVCGVPVLSTRIPAAEHLLGADHPGLFPRGDADALAERLLRMERDPAFAALLAERSRAAAPRFHPDREREAWKALLLELGLPARDP